MVEQSGDDLIRPPMAQVYDELDRQIIHFLREDGRMSIVTMARRLGVGQPTVRRRLNKLLSSGGVRVRALLDPGVASPTGAATFVMLKVELARLNDIVAALREMPEVAAVSIVDGACNVIMSCIFESRDDWLEFYTHKLAPLPGIKDWTAHSVLRVAKLSQAFGWDRPS